MEEKLKHRAESLIASKLSLVNTQVAMLQREAGESEQAFDNRIDAVVEELYWYVWNSPIIEVFNMTRPRAQKDARVAKVTLRNRLNRWVEYNFVKR